MDSHRIALVAARKGVVGDEEVESAHTERDGDNADSAEGDNPPDESALTREPVQQQADVVPLRNRDNKPVSNKAAIKKPAGDEASDAQGDDKGINRGGQGQ